MVAVASIRRDPNSCLRLHALAANSNKEESRRRTRTADLLQLRVITQALQGFAVPCKPRISRRLSLLWVAACCTVLRSRWYQSGINRGLASSQYRSLAHASDVRPAPR